MGAGVSGDSLVPPRRVGAPDLERIVALIRERVLADLSGPADTWLASFAGLVATAEESGVPTAGLQSVLTSHPGPDADGEVLDQEKREALIDALVGRWAAARYLERGADGSSET